MMTSQKQDVKPPNFKPLLLQHLKKSSELENGQVFTSLRPDLDLLSSGREVMSHFSRWPERGQERTLKPVLSAPEVNDILSLHFNRPLIPISGLFLIKHEESALIAYRPLGMLGQNSGTLPQKHKCLFHCMSVARLKPWKEPHFSQKPHLKHSKSFLEFQ